MSKALFVAGNFCLTLALSFVSAQSTLAGGIVTVPDDSHLRAAMAGGGIVTFAVDGTIKLTNTITVGTDTTLDGSGRSVVISGGNAVRLFQVNTGVVFGVNELTLADGRFVGTTGRVSAPIIIPQDGFGAGILNQGGIISLTSCTLTNHSVLGGSGDPRIAIAATNQAGANGFGAALCNLGGQVGLTNCLLVGNGSQGGLAGGEDYLDFAGASGHGWGGAIYSRGGILSLSGVAFETNSAIGGAAQDSDEATGVGGDGIGGAIYATNSEIYASDSMWTGNTATAAAPEADTNLRSGSGLGGALFLSVGSTGQIRRSNFLGNSAIGAYDYWSGAGAGNGGAVFANDVLRVSDARFSGNAAVGGDLLEDVAPAAAGRGGAIYATATTAISGSTFDNNQTQGGAGGTGGGPSQGGSIWISGTLTATNSTWTLNEAFGSGAASGGAVFLTNASALLVNVTIAQNRADGGTPTPTNYPPGPSLGGGLSTTNSSTTVFGSIIANSGNGGNVWGHLTDGGYNLCSDGTANFSAIGSLNNVDPLLGALANNGGPTPTLPLLVGSPARDVIPSGFPATDQRGVARPQGPEADMGAFEADYVAGPPTIANQPQGGTVRAGTNFTFTVVAVGSGPLSYQWRKNGNLIPGRTTNTLTLANVQAQDAGTYSVMVSNNSGTTPSQGAVLVVDSTPRILAQPTSVVVPPGATTNFTVSADGPALNFQWWHDGNIVVGATNSTLNIASALAGAQGGYWVVITNFAGNLTSQVATLTFDASALSILVPPQNQTVESGYPATFTVVVSGVPPFTYQWQHNGTVVPGATNSALVLTSAHNNDAGSYLAIVSNGYAIVRSAAAQLTITPGAVAPLLVVGKLGDTLTITFTGEGGRTYRLLSSSDFAGWTSVATNTPLAPGLVQFTQPISDVGRVFYRVATP